MSLFLNWLEYMLNFTKSWYLWLIILGPPMLAYEYFMTWWDKRLVRKRNSESRSEPLDKAS